MTRRLAAIVAAAALGCGARLPETRYYQLATPATDRVRAPRAVVVLEPLTTEAGYDDERIVYRLTPYRLDYYNYHRWSAPPGIVVGRALERALERGGRLRVVGAPVDDARLAISGHVVALEEVDVTAQQWVGHVAIELRATDRRTGAVVWSADYDDSERLLERSPEGLARALAIAIGRIAVRAEPAIAELACLPE